MMQRPVWTEPYSAMFRSSSAAAAPPQRQPLLQSNQQNISPPKKSLASGLRSLLFHNGEESPEHHGNGEHVAEPPPPPAKTAPPTKIKQVVPEFVPPTPVSPPSQAAQVKKGHPRDTFHRSNSHPIRLDASAALSASRSFDPSMTRAAALDPSSLQTPSRTAPGDLTQQAQQTPGAAPSLRSTVFGSCSHVLSTVVGVLFQTIKEHHEYIKPRTGAELASPETSSTDSRVRKAKLLYIALLEKAQKERGEWQGFGSRNTNQQSNNELEEEQESVEESATDVLLAALEDATKEDGFAVLHELLELSFRNLRVSLLTPAVYSEHKRELAKESLVSPVPLSTLLRVGSFVNDLNRDEKSCLLRLMSLWHARCLVDPEQQEIRSIIEERYPLILTECSEVEFMQQVARKSARLDPVAVDLLMVMVQHRDLLFSDVELYSIRQEMRLTPLIQALGEEGPEEAEQPGQPEQLEGSEPEENDTTEQVVEYLFQDASSQVDPPANTNAGTQVDALQTQHSGTQMESCPSQDASTQVEVNCKDLGTQVEVDYNDLGIQVAVDHSDQGTQAEEAAESDRIGCPSERSPPGGLASQAEAATDPTVSLAPPAAESVDEQLLDEPTTSAKTNSMMAAPTQLAQAIEQLEPAVAKKKKAKASKRMARKTTAGSNKSRVSTAMMNPTGKGEQLQACDSSQMKSSRAATLRARKKKKFTPRIAVPLVAGTHHIHAEVSQLDKATETMPAALETTLHEATIPYAYVGLSIAAAALGAAATLALQIIRKPS